jgi:hypothetical protein
VALDRVRDLRGKVSALDLMKSNYESEAKQMNNYKDSDLFCRWEIEKYDDMLSFDGTLTKEDAPALIKIVEKISENSLLTK